jgi:ribosome recycling factor|tara:strand:- start:1026 stop:1598 length:573 start_codon:yes stop_codon:yes gene_type:complete
MWFKKMLEETLVDAKKRMSGAVEVLRRDLVGVRTGRASVGLVENIKVNYFGSDTALNQLAQINVGDSRMIVIQPWDKSATSDISKAIQNSDLSISPNVDGDIIRLNLPPLTEERRREIVRMVKSRGEESKVAVRNIRRDAQGTIRDIEKDGLASQDECRRSQTGLEKITSEAINQIDVESQNKEKEVMQI